MMYPRRSVSAWLSTVCLFCALHAGCGRAPLTPVQQIKDLFGSGKFDQAIELCDQLLAQPKSLEPAEHAEVLMYKGRCFWEQSDVAYRARDKQQQAKLLELADAVLSESIAITQTAAALHLRSMVRDKMGLTEQATADLLASRELDPELQRAYINQPDSSLPSDLLLSNPSDLDADLDEAESQDTNRRRRRDQGDAASGEPTTSPHGDERGLAASDADQETSPGETSNRTRRSDGSADSGRVSSAFPHVPGITDRPGRQKTSESESADTDEQAEDDSRDVDDLADGESDELDDAEPLTRNEENESERPLIPLSPFGPPNQNAAIPGFPPPPDYPLATGVHRHLREHPSVEDNRVGGVPATGLTGAPREAPGILETPSTGIGGTNAPTRQPIVADRGPTAPGFAAPPSFSNWGLNPGPALPYTGALPLQQRPAAAKRLGYPFALPDPELFRPQMQAPQFPTGPHYSPLRPSPLTTPERFQTGPGR